MHAPLGNIYNISSAKKRQNMTTNDDETTACNGTYCQYKLSLEYIEGLLEEAQQQLQALVELIIAHVPYETLALDPQLSPDIKEQIRERSPWA